MPATKTRTLPRIGLRVTIPSGWRVYDFIQAADPSDSQRTYISSQVLKDPCKSSAKTCKAFDLGPALGPGDVMIFWTWAPNGCGSCAQRYKPAINVDGHQASLTSNTITSDCPVGAVHKIQSFIDNEPMSDDSLKDREGVTIMTACLSGPNLAANAAAVHQMLASVRFT